MLLCTFGVHRWIRKDTARAGTSVYRCTRCEKRLVMHRARRRIAKRYVLLTAALVSAVTWFAIINLALTGRTRVIHTTSVAVWRADEAGRAARRTLHRIQGDSGTYVDGAGRKAAGTRE